jgi:peptidoglycan/LPS O-acetylase OafA/YrhL
MPRILALGGRVRALKRSVKADQLRLRDKAKRENRPEIQGLRAFAVMAVVADHLFEWPSGGFVGVDIFFVISGFLITGLLVRELERTGTISFVSFYKRRIRRILPASTLTIVVTVIASFALLNVLRASEILSDGVWALLFSANWRFALAGTDYFAAAGPLSPLQHFWSLAVEEQFYFVWPGLLLLVFAVFAHRLQWRVARAKAAVCVSILVVIAASFGWAALESATNPSVAYFSTLSRAWELAVGAVLAVGATGLARIPKRIRPVLAWVGCIGLVASLFAIDSTASFPAPWALLPVVSTSLVIAAGTGGKVEHLWPLTNRVSSYLGDLSFSLYLWHFPVIVFMTALMPLGWGFYGVTILLIGFFSVFAYHLVEDPIRKSLWLDPKYSRAERRAIRRRSRLLQASRKASPTKWFAGSFAIVLTAALVVIALAPANQPAGALLPVTELSEPGSALESDGSASNQALAGLISAAVSEPAWPELDPGVEELGRGSLASEWVVDGCLAREQRADTDWKANAASCVYGDADATNNAILFGDSVGISWMPAIRSALAEGWSVQVIAMTQCSVSNVSSLKSDGTAYPECGEFREWALGEIARQTPKLTIVSTADANVTRLEGDPSRNEALQLWSDGLTESLERIRLSSARTVVLAAPPTGQSLSECMTTLNGPRDCVSGVSPSYDQVSKAEEFSVESLSDSSVSYVPTKSWFCTPDNDCPPIVGNTPVRADPVHLTSAYSSSLGDVIQPYLLQAEQ